MHLCYIDESGDSQAILLPGDDVQPLLVIGAIFIDSKHIKALTGEFIQLKRQFYPAALKHLAHDLDVLLLEIKGSDIRKDIRNSNLTSKKLRHHFQFLDGVQNANSLTSYRQTGCPLSPPPLTIGAGTAKGVRVQAPSARPKPSNDSSGCESASL